MNVFSQLARGATRSPYRRRTHYREIVGLVVGGALVAASLVAVGTGPAQASTPTLNSADQGWYRSDGLSLASNTNYITGYYAGDEYRSWFGFDLANTSCTITSATLRLPNPNPASGTLSTLSLRAVTTPLAQLVPAHASGDATGLATFADLGDGTLYGSVTLTAANTNPVDVTLNSDAIAALNASRTSTFALGGAYAITQTTTQDLFSGTDSARYPPQLLLTCTDTAPWAPAAPAAVATDGQVALTWTAPPDGGATIQSYTVSYRPSGTTGAWSTQSAPSTSASVNGLTNYTSYDFTVFATNIIGDGPPSAVTTATPLPSTAVPEAPIDLEATAGDGEVLLAWTVPYDGGTPITGYVVSYREAYARKWMTVTRSGALTSTAVGGLSNTVTYDFKVAATNLNGPGPYSSVVSATPLAAEAPGTPTDLVVGTPVSDGRTVSVPLSWTDNGPVATDHQVTIYSYRVSSKSGVTYREIGTVLTGSGESSYTVTGLSARKDYAFTVAAGNAAGWSLPTDRTGAVG